MVDFSKYGTPVTPQAPVGAPQKPASQGSDFSKYGTVSSQPVTQQPKQGLLQKAGGFLGGVARDITKPVVELATRPYQAAKSIASTIVDPLAEPNLDVNLPFYGKIEAPKTGEDVVKDIGRGAQTVAFGLGPVAGGAAFGGGAALEQGGGLKEVALGTLGGAAIGKATDVALPLIGAGVKSTGRALQTISAEDALRQSAQKNIENILNPTKQINKNITAKIAPRLAEESPFAFTRSGYLEKLQKPKTQFGEAIEGAYQALPKGTTGSTSPISEGIEELQRKLLVPVSGASDEVIRTAPVQQVLDVGQAIVSESDRAKFNALEKIKADILAISDQSGEAEVGSLKKLQRALGKKGKFFTDSDAALSEARKSSYGVIKDELAKQFPDIDVLNKEFSFWKNASDVLEQTIERKTGQGIPLGEKLSTAAGVAGGLAGGGVGTAIQGGLLLRYLNRAVNSTAWNSASAILKTRLANALSKGDEAGAIAALKGIIGATGQMLEVTGGVLSRAPKTLREFPKKELDLSAPKKFGLSIEDVSKKGKGAIPKELAPLAEEARKYKTAEEFVKAQGETVYRGGGFDNKKITELGVSVSRDKRIANTFDPVRGNLGTGVSEDLAISPTARIAREIDIPKELATRLNEKGTIGEQAVVNWGKKNGYDAIDFGEITGVDEIRVINPDILKTKSQLTDIWNKAKGMKQ